MTWPQWLRLSGLDRSLCILEIGERIDRHNEEITNPTT
jgi:hypothetical protein